MASNQKLILYIEDNPANVRLMDVFFSRLDNVTFKSFDNAEDGLSFLSETKPDLILMDINLNGMSGIDATEIIQNTPELSDIPVIALTAAAMQENIDAAEGLFTHYITKPIDFGHLTKVIKPYV